MTNTLTTDVGAPSRRSGAPRRPASTSSACPARTRRRPGAEGHRRQVEVPIVADIHFHYKRAIEAADSGAACLRINPGNIGSAERVTRGGQGRPGPRLLDAHRRQCRLAGEGPAGKIRRALPGSDGGERAGPREHPAGSRFPRLQDQREGVGRVPGGRRLSAAGRGLRPPAAYRHHRGGRPAHRHGEVGDRPGLAAVGRHRRHAARLALGRAGGRGPGRLGHAEGAGHPPSRREDHLLPVLRPPGLQRHQDGARRWRSGWRISRRR